MRDSYIKLLQAQPNQNFGNSNTKINIHIPIRGEMQKYCINLNQEIENLTESGISFRPDSFQIPHITLYMGFVKNEMDFRQIMHLSYEISQELTTFKIEPTKAYVKKPKNNYIFIDTKQSEYIISIKQLIKDRLGVFMEPLKWDVVNEIPHITVGYIKKDFNRIETFLNSYHSGPSFIADAIEISYGGPWGSCIGTIRTFEFKEFNFNIF